MQTRSPIAPDHIHQHHHTLIICFPNLDKVLSRQILWRPSARKGMVFFISDNMNLIASLNIELCKHLQTSQDTILPPPGKVNLSTYQGALPRIMLECHFELLKSVYGEATISLMPKRISLMPNAASAPLNPSDALTQYKTVTLPRLLNKIRGAFFRSDYLLEALRLIRNVEMPVEQIKALIKPSQTDSQFFNAIYAIRKLLRCDITILSPALSTIINEQDVGLATWNIIDTTIKQLESPFSTQQQFFSGASPTALHAASLASASANTSSEINNSTRVGIKTLKRPRTDPGDDSSQETYHQGPDI